MPGDLDFDVSVVDGECGLQAGLLPVGEMLLPGTQQVADPIQRIISAAAVAVDVLLDPAADLIDRGRAELDHVEGVEHRDGVVQLVVDGASVAVEWVQGGDLDAFSERVAAVTQPRRVGLTGAARDQVQEPGPDASVLVAGEIDHAGELLRAAAALVDGLGGDVMPDVFVDAQ